MSEQGLSNLLHEKRRFDPPKELAEAANVKADAYERADGTAWRSGKAGRAAHLGQDVGHGARLDNPPFAKWFVGGQLNAAYNCVDRHVEAGHGDKVALHWEGEPGDTRTLTYADLQREVSQAANVLHRARRQGRRPGRDLHADDPRDGRRDARLRPDRRAAHGRLRRLLRRGAGRPDPGLRRQRRRHRRRRLPARRRPPLKPAVDEALEVPRRPTRRRRPAHRPGRRLDRGPRRLVARPGRQAVAPSTPPSRSTPSTRSTSCTPRARPASPRASCTPPAAT